MIRERVTICTPATREAIEDQAGSGGLPRGQWRDHATDGRRLHRSLPGRCARDMIQRRYRALWGNIAPTVPDDDPTELPDGARRLLAGPIDSFEKLDLVIVLRSSGNAPQGLDALDTRMGAPTTVLARALDELAAAGVVVQQPAGWLLAPDYDRAAIEDLAQAWSSQRAAVLNVMTHRSLERIRASAARTFADAFTLRRRRKSGRGEGDG